VIDRLTNSLRGGRTVSRTRRNPGQHSDLRAHADAHRCCVKSLIASALVGFCERQHARAESISKRARSTTPTSLRFRINELRTVWNSVAQNAPSNLTVARSIWIQRFTAEAKMFVQKIVSDLL